MILKQRLRKVIAMSTISVVATTCVPATMAVPVTSATQEMPLIRAAGDYENHWAAEAINKWVELEVLQGYEDSSIRPKQAVTRGELAAMISRVFGLESKKGAKNYTDVNHEKWYAEYVQKISAAGIMNDEKNTFRPEETATREEAAYAIAKAYHIYGNQTLEFIDNEQISQWAQDEISALVAGGYISGRTDGTFAPREGLTRADVAVMLDKITALVIHKKGTYTEDIQGNLVINTEDVILENMKVAGNLYIAEGVAQGDLTLKNVVIEGKVIVEGGGENSIKLVDTKVNDIEVNKAEGAVRIVADKKSEMGQVKAYSAAKLEGKIKSVEIATSESVKFANATVENMKVTVANTKLELSPNTKVTKFIANAEVKVNGGGEIKEVEVNANDVKFSDIKIENVTVDKNVSTAPVVNKPTGGGGGGGLSSGGSSSGSTSDKNEGTGNNGTSDKNEEVGNEGDSDKNEGAGSESDSDKNEGTGNEGDSDKNEGDSDKDEEAAPMPPKELMVTGKVSLAETKPEVVTINLFKVVADELIFVQTIKTDLAGNYSLIVEEKGEYRIEATYEVDGKRYYGVTENFNMEDESINKDIELKVENTPVIPVEEIILSHVEAELFVGETLQLVAQVLPDEATYKEVKWTSSDESILSISQNGKAVAKSKGEVIITAAVGEMTASCTVKVTALSVIGQVALDGQIAEGVSVTLIKKGASFVRQVQKTDAQGKYQFNNVLPGEYELEVAYEGTEADYYEMVSDIKVNDEDITKEISLQATTSLRFDGIDKSGNKINIAPGEINLENQINGIAYKTVGINGKNVIILDDIAAINTDINYVIDKHDYHVVKDTFNTIKEGRNVIEVTLEEVVQPTYEDASYKAQEGNNPLGLGDTTYKALKEAGWRIESENKLSVNGKTTVFENMEGENGIDAIVTIKIADEKYDVDTLNLLKLMIEPESAVSYEDLVKLIANGSNTVQDGARTIKIQWDGNISYTIKITFTNF